MATSLQLMHETTMEAPVERVAVRRLAALYFGSMLMVLMTGAIRKWIFPGSAVFYLAQDVPIAIAYLYAIWTGMFTRGYMFLGIIVLGTVLTLQALLQIIVLGLPPFVAIVGLHHYFFYVPMLAIFPLCLTVYYRRKLVWWMLMLGIPHCALAVLQAISPKNAWVNKTSEGDAFGVPGAEIARVTGLFNFTAFYGLWVGITVAYCLGEWLVPPERRIIKKRWMLIVCTVAANLSYLISASRGAVATASTAIAGALIAAVLMKSRRALVATAGMLVLLPLGAAATYALSPDEFNVLTERLTGQTYVDEGKGRVSDSLLGFLVVPQFSLIGAGIGVGVDAAHLGNANAYQFTYDLSEQDTIRNVMELGSPVGLFYVLTRALFLLGLFFLACRIVQQGGDPHVLPLAVLLFISGYLNDMTRNATMTGTQIILGCAFILGAYYYPDNQSVVEAAPITL